MTYLQKMIDQVSLDTNAEISAKPAKVCKRFKPAHNLFDHHQQTFSYLKDAMFDPIEHMRSHRLWQAWSQKIPTHSCRC